MHVSIGGVPVVRRVSAVAAAQGVGLGINVGYLIVRNKGAAAAKLYFTATDAADDINYIDIPVASAILPYGEWAGPVQTHPGDRADLWVASAGGTTLEVVGFQRR